MTGPLAIYGLVFASFLLANLPWLNERLLLVLPLRGGRKAFWLRLAEWIVGFGLAAVLAWRLELGCATFTAFIGLEPCPGEIFAKTWEFYSVALVLFAVFALPGFIYFIERRRNRPA